MSWQRLAWVAIVTVVASVGPAGRAAADSSEFAEPLADAARELEMAQLRLRRYDAYEYPLALRRLESQIKLAQAELESWRRRVREYEQFDKFVGSAPVLLTLDEARLAVLRYQTGLDDLVHEKELLERSRRDQYRLLKLEVDAAARRLALARKAARAAR